MTIAISNITAEEVGKLLTRQEGHFLDMKGRRIAPAKLTRSISAFANADGGELLIGVEEVSGSFRWDGFAKPEDANAHIQVFEHLFPLGGEFEYELLASDGATGLVLRASVAKSRAIKKASDGTPYLRRGAQNLPITSAEALSNLQRAKGLISHEDATLQADPTLISNSEQTIEFMLEVIPESEPDAWLRKQQLIVDEKPTVAGAMLFADEPQVLVPKGAVKIYRYRTTDQEGARDTLAFDPISIEGSIYEQIKGAVGKTVELTEKIQIMTATGLQSIKYPHESLHEIITNAVLHRDYAYNDDVHVRIFDNRVEVESPGRLPAHITPSNILSERFARNAKIVRLINKFPNAPNKDVGEGLNTAFQAMKKLRLRDPEIVERDNSVMVVIRHETLASPEQTIVEYLQVHETINNAKAREITGVPSEIKMRAVFKKLLRAEEIEQVPGTQRSTTTYRLPTSAKKKPSKTTQGGKGSLARR
jgi:ATP-dependent DNA helicase RecG